MNLSIVAPTCLDEQSLPEFLEALETFTLMSPFGVQALIVDDGSSERVGRWLVEESGRRPWMTVLRIPPGGGLGAALKSGAAQASYPLVAWVGSTGDRLDDLWEMRRRLIDGADLVVASRAAAAGGYGRRRGLQAWGSWLFSRIVRQVWTLPVADCTNCYCAFRKEALGELSLVQDDFTIGLELLLKADARDWRIEETPTVRLQRAGREGFLALWRIGTAYVRLLGRSLLTRLSGAG